MPRAFWLASLRQQASPDVVANFRNSRFPGQIPECRVIAEELNQNVTDLKGHDLVVVKVGHNDTNYTTCLHVPSVSLKGYCNYYSVPTGAKKSVNAV